MSTFADARRARERALLVLRIAELRIAARRQARIAAARQRRMDEEGCGAVFAAARAVLEDW